jgi:glycosyltransferase involved in cell wall biosynthesis
MVRILHLIDTGGPGGAETVLADLVEALPQDLWSSRIIVPREEWLFSRLEDAHRDVRVIPSRGAAAPGLIRALMREIRSFKPSLIHAHFLGSGVYGTLASSLTDRCPLVCTFHGLSDVGSSDRLLPVKARILSRDRNRVVYVSHFLRRHLEPTLGVPGRLGLVIHNGVRFSETGGSGVARAALGVAPGTIVIGSVGNLRKAKDYPNLLRAARIVCARKGNVHFVIVGQWVDELGGELLRLRETLGLVERVSFLGFRKDVSALMSGFDLFVSSSSSEGLPLASLEAMGLGKPMVLTRCGGVPEMVEDGRTGSLVPPRDPEALARGILSLLGAPETAARLGSEAREVARRRFSLSNMATNYQELYRRLMKEYPLHQG